MQTAWAASINPVLSLPINNGLLLRSIALVNGAFTFNHRLGRKMQGWILTDVNGSANIYRSQPLNDITLTLTSSAAVVVDLFVF